MNNKKSVDARAIVPVGIGLVGVFIALVGAFLHFTATLEGKDHERDTQYHTSQAMVFGGFALMGAARLLQAGADRAARWREDAKP